MLRRRISIVFVVLVLLALQTATVSAEDVHWSYDGESGPAYWGVLNPDWALCGTGEQQSPIDIPSSAPANPADLATSYDPSALTIFNNGHTIQVNYDAGSTLQVDGKTYELLQYHFHAASEHTVDGSARPMELHLVHRNAEGGLAVIGVLLEEGAENSAYAPIFEHLPPNESEPEAVPDVTVNAADLLPESQTYWRYNGSLTTPPCSQDVKWLVMNTAVALGTDQIGAYTAIYDHNARPVQAMNAREFIVGQQPDMLPVTGGGVDELQTFAVVATVLLVLVGATAVTTKRRRLA